MSADDTDGKPGPDDETTPDVNALAREYLDLWQKQLAATASDETLAKTMSDAVRLMSAGAAQVAAMTMTPPAEATPDHDVDADPSAGAPAAGVAHRNGDGAHDEPARRVAELEERVAELESEAREARRRADRQRR